MALATTRLRLAALLVAVASSGCGPGPYNRAAAAYGEATEASAVAIAQAPATADRVCRRKARLAYLQTRLGLLETPAPIGWNDWYAGAKATEKQTWAQHCADLAASGKVFGAALGALRQYASALRSLASAGQYDGADLKTSADGAARIAAALESPEAAAVAKPAGNLVAKFATFLLDDITADQLEDYTRRADPLVQPLVESLERYVESLEAQVSAAESFQRDTLRALEVRSGLEGPDPADPAKLLAFHAFALIAEEEITETRATLAGYRSVLKRVRIAHTAMVKAGAAGDELEIKKALGSVFELATELQALGTAAAPKE